MWPTCAIRIGVGPPNGVAGAERGTLEPWRAVVTSPRVAAIVARLVPPTAIQRPCSRRLLSSGGTGAAAACQGSSGGSVPAGAESGGRSGRAFVAVELAFWIVFSMSDPAGRLAVALSIVFCTLSIAFCAESGVGRGVGGAGGGAGATRGGGESAATASGRLGFAATACLGVGADGVRGMGNALGRCDRTRPAARTCWRGDCTVGDCCAGAAAGRCPIASRLAMSMLWPSTAACPPTSGGKPGRPMPSQTAETAPSPKIVRTARSSCRWCCFRSDRRDAFTIHPGGGRSSGGGPRGRSRRLTRASTARTRPSTGWPIRRRM